MNVPFKAPDGAVQKALQAAEDAAKAVMEKLPLKFATRELVQKAQADVDAQLLIAVERYLGASLADPEVLRGRLAHVDAPEGRTFSMDGVNILWVGSLAVTREGDALHGEHKFEHFERPGSDATTNGN